MSITTAITTPRLKLMKPADADDFTPADFVATFGILDNTPGVTPVANNSTIKTLEATLTPDQNGSLYIQNDNGALWQFVMATTVQPGKGVMRRVNTGGMLRSVPCIDPFAATAGAGDAEVVTQNRLVPPTTFVAQGGRNVFAYFTVTGVGNTGTYHWSKICLWMDGQVMDRSQMFNVTGHGISHRIMVGLGVLAADVTHTIVVTLSGLGSVAVGDTSVNSVGGSAGHLYVFEI